MSIDKLIISILVIGAVTFFTRAFPFLVFGHGEKPSAWILYLGKYLPPAIICAIIVYCFKDTAVTHAPFGLPEIFCSALVIAVHKLKSNTMLSIVAGTLCYMFIVQLI